MKYALTTLLVLRGGVRSRMTGMAQVAVDPGAGTARVQATIRWQPVTEPGWNLGRESAVSSAAAARCSDRFRADHNISPQA